MACRPRRSRVRPLLLFAFIAAASGAAHAAPTPLPAQVRQVLATRAFAGQGVGVYAVRVGDASPLASYGADEPLAPASTLKVLTAACALETLGPDWTYETRFAADARPDRAGAVRTLYVVGSGDPTFRPEDLWSALSDLAASGVRRIAGDIVLDDTLFEEPGRPASWPAPLAVPTPYDAPQGALSLAWNAAELVVRAAPRAGQRASAELLPIPELLRIDNAVSTGQRTLVTLAVDRLPDGPHVRLGGTVERGREFREWIHLGHPTEAFGAGLARLLPRAGIAFGGSIRRGRTPSGAVPLVIRRSLPLGQILGPVVKHSSNFGAEMALRTLAAASGHRPATTAEGALAVVGCLDRWRVPHAGVNVLDGSGYGRGNRLTARVLVDVLLAARTRPWSGAFVESLPIAREDGTMRRRLSDLRGLVRAKTGTLDDVSALAGYATTPGGHEIAFAILLNKRHRGPAMGHPSVDAVVRAIVAAADGKPMPPERQYKRRRR